MNINIKNNQFAKGSLIMVVGFNIYNVGQLIYHFIVARLLGKASYGDLATIITLLGVVAIIQMAAGLTIVKFIAAEKKPAQINNFVKWVFWWSLWLAAGLGLLTLIFSPVLVKFLNISQPQSVFLIGPILFFFFLANSNRSILQGLFKFDHYVGSLLVESLFKIVLTVILILVGWKVFGAMVAFLFAIFLSFIVTVFSIKKYLKGGRGLRPEIKPLLLYSLPVLLQGIALTSMYSMDIVLVKHFFSPDQAGIYDSMAILGRIVFFGTAPITNVMFPLVAKRHRDGEKYHTIFYSSLLLIIGIASFVTLAYFIAPKLIITLLLGKVYLEGAMILGWFGIVMLLLALAMLLTQFYLSIGKTKIVYLFILSAILQVILIWFNHPNLLTVVQMSIVSASLLDLILFVYFLIKVR
jgi:O-antigen/teichoic acid export membrane protein